MSFKFISIYCLSILLIVSILFLYFFYKKKSKFRFAGLIGFSIISIISVFGIIITILSKGLTPQHAMLLSGYSSSFYKEYNAEIIESNDYTIFLDRFSEQENPNIIITVKKEGLFYKTIDNVYVNYTSDSFQYGKNIDILSYQIGNRYIHFLEFRPTYFEELGHIGYLLPSKVIVNGVEVEVHSYLYFYSEEPIKTINVNNYDFILGN